MTTVPKLWIWVRSLVPQFLSIRHRRYRVQGVCEVIMSARLKYARQRNEGYFKPVGRDLRQQMQVGLRRLMRLVVRGLSNRRIERGVVIGRRGGQSFNISSSQFWRTLPANKRAQFLSILLASTKPHSQISLRIAKRKIDQTPCTTTLQKERENIASRRRRLN